MCVCACVCVYACPGSLDLYNAKIGEFHVSRGPRRRYLYTRMEDREGRGESRKRTSYARIPLFISIELLSVASWFRYFELVHLFFFFFLRGIPNGKERIKVALRIRPTFLALYRRCFHRRRERYRGDIKLQLKQLKFNRSFATRIMINRSDSWQHSSRESMWRKKE